MTPPPGERLLRFVGDTVRFTLRAPGPDSGCQARLRTNLGRAALVREEIIHSHFQKLPLAGASWRDLPMRWQDGEWTLTLPLAEVGFFKVKGYAIDARGYQHWPDGPDLGIATHPDAYRTANTIYCAFTRMFGATRTHVTTHSEQRDAQLRVLDKQGYTVIPPSGKFRDLLQQIPHIFDTLGCRILHLLPVNPAPTTFAKFGRFGSPYACQDLMLVDPALVEFDQRTTGVEQFCELTSAAHERGGRVFLDLVINHTGWGAPLQELHPEWYLRDEKGNFVCPGAWSVVWEDLVELEHTHAELWEHLAEVFLTWCRRGVDGFRCDAGYKVPLPAWQYITARVRQEFPDALFLLEGLGGSWEVTENLLNDGGMQWAYSELFQNYSGQQVAGYLDYALRQSARLGVYVHYSETHDNLRLAEKGRAWSLMRNRLCALASVSGGFGFTGGVEWLATERVNVHSSRGMSWGSDDNLLAELGQLNRLLADHPCFFDGAKLTRLSADDSPVFALRRDSAEGRDTVLVLVNTDPDRAHTVTLDLASGAPHSSSARPTVDLLGGALPKLRESAGGKLTVTVEPAACHCLSPHATPLGLCGDTYRRARAQAAWAIAAMSHATASETSELDDWRALAAAVEQSPFAFLAAISQHGVPALAGVTSSRLKPGLRTKPALDLSDGAGEFAVSADATHYPRVVRWAPADQRRVTLVPPGHWLLIQDTVRFRATLDLGDGRLPQHAESIAVRDGHVACFAPRADAADATLTLERFSDTERVVIAQIRHLAPEPQNSKPQTPNPEHSLVLLTNGRGAMARMCVDLGRITSKYDCVLGANLHATLPVDRHVFVKRVRAWLNADGFITPLNGDNLVEFQPGPPAHWRFVASAGDGRSVVIELTAAMPEGQNATVLRFSRPAVPSPLGRPLPQECSVSLTVRVDLEDRNFHSETQRNSGSEHHFTQHCHPLPRSSRREEAPTNAERGMRNAESSQSLLTSAATGIGFAFTPAVDRQLRVWADGGAYHHEAEWSVGIPHPVEQSRGQTGSGDAYSPGWFELPLTQGAAVTLIASAESESSASAERQTAMLPLHEPRSRRREEAEYEVRLLTSAATDDGFTATLIRAVRAFVVRRDDGRTVIAGYPWFLDWGRDTLICARGLLAAGMDEDVRQLLITFGRFEQDGTLPNTIHGADASNRDTTDAPLWYGVVCEEAEESSKAAAAVRSSLYSTLVAPGGRTIADVLRGIAAGYVRGTPNGIRMDPASALIWSPSHFTWMDTNYPAATPREGYPVEIQVLWIRLLRQLARLGAAPDGKPWADLATLAEKSFHELFWLEERGWFADVLLAKAGVPARAAAPDTALRSNGLFAVSLGLVTGERARRCVDAAARHLVVPGALRSLAPLPVSPPLPVRGNDGRLLNDPLHPYWGRYEGDEDTRRKPAYHNGTAWTWTFPVFCEALARAWDFAPEAVAAARAYLGSTDRLLAEGCLGHLPEIVDGDAPHAQRGCDAQAWGATEALRVWRLLNEPAGR